MNNSEKYAGSDIDVTVSEYEETVNFTDRVTEKATDKERNRVAGKAADPDEDMPFIFDKFYRGHNKCDKPGSDLGLFTVKYSVEKQKGRIEIENVNPGLSVKIYFRCVCEADAE